MESIAQYNKNRWYIVKLNNKPITVHVEEKQYTMIIPFMLKIKSVSNTTFLNEETLINEVKISKGENINMIIESYTCSYEAYKMHISCNSDKEKLIKKLTNDTIYNLYIRHNKSQKVMYDGILISDISKYFPEKGEYFVYITGKYENVESYIDLIVIVI